jgi:hypothetical protein
LEIARQRHGKQEMVMNKLLRNVLIGFGVTFVTGFVLGFLESASGPSAGTSWTLPVVFGGLAFLVLQMKSGNRKETRADDSVRQAALNAAVPPGQASVYIYREGFAGKAVGWNVALDGVGLAQLKSPRFTCTTVAPGHHTLSVSLGGLAGTQNKPSEMAFEARVGEILVYAMKARIRALSSTLTFVLEPDARAALKKLAGIPMVAPDRPGTVIAA